MPLVPGLSANIRQPPPPSPDDPSPVDIAIVETEGDAPQFNDNGDIVRIEHSDGSITVSLDGKPIENAEHKGPSGWFDNLCDKIPDVELYAIADDLLRGIEEDQQSRKEWVDDRATGIRLLGFKIELPQSQGAADGAPVEGMSRVRHPLLGEAVLRFQANARSEMLPTDGPAKVKVDGILPGDDALANKLELDLNHYLTTTATEYVPDTDRMFLMLGFGGTTFKKVYFCPLKQRPVSETVDADDLIVNNSATDLANAKRITHRSYMRPSLVRRMQIIGVYREVDLSTPKETVLDEAQREKRQQQGVTQTTMRPDDRDREIYEIYCELDIIGFEHKKKGEPTGLPIPYRVTIDVSTRIILSIVRNYDEDTKELPEARVTFIKYTFVPGFGFYDLGLVHILGNTTNGLTAAWREMLDAGMFASFPGFLIAKAGKRQQTNILRVPAGGSAEVDTGGMKIGEAVMPLPYKDASPGLFNLAEHMEQTGQRVGGTAELQVGEGSANAPVGTTLSMIEQATKIMNAVHKRMHAAQSEELGLIVQCFREHPEAFWSRNKRPAYKWDQKTFLQALDDYDLVPKSDPNTSSFGQRALKYMALALRSQQNPTLYNPIEVETAILSDVLQFSNPQRFLAPVSAMAKPPPEVLEMQAKAQADNTKAQAAMVTAQARMIDAKNGKSTSGLAGAEPDTPAEQQIKLMQAQTDAKKVAVDHQNNLMDARDKQAQLAQDQRNNQAALVVEHAKHQDEMRLEHMKLQVDQVNADRDRAADHQHAAQEALLSHVEHQQDRADSAQEAQASRQHEAEQAKAAAKAKSNGKPKE